MALYRKLKSGVWYYSVYVPGREKRLRGSCGTKDKDEATLVENTMRIAAGRKSPKEHIIRLIEALYAEDKPSDLVPLGAVFFEYGRVLKVAGKVLGASTMDIRRIRLRAFADWCAKNFPAVEDIRDVNRLCAQRFASSLKCGNKTVRNFIGDLSSVWNELKRAHDGIENPWPLAMPAKKDEGRGECFTEEEAARIFKAGDDDGHGWGLAARISAATGLRMGDVVTLRHEDIQGGVIRIKPRKTQRHGIATVLPLPPEIAAMVGSGTGYVMPELGDDYEAGGTMRHPFKRVLVAAGVDASKYTFHSFRHFFRTRLAAAGVSDDVAMRLGGWTQRNTAARYDHDEHVGQLADAIARAWK